MALAGGPAENGSLDLAPPPAVDIMAFRSYLAALLQPMMGVSRAALETTLFADPAFEDKAARFAADPGVMVAYITQSEEVAEHAAPEDSAEDGAPESAATTTTTYELCLPPLPPFSPHIRSTLSLIKRGPVLSTAIPFGAQLHFIQLSAAALATTLKGGSKDGGEGAAGGGAGAGVGLGLDSQAPYESLHSVLHWGVTPWFEAFVGARREGHTVDATGAGKKGGEAQTGIPVAKRKFAELELSLLHLQQNVEIPEVHLAVDPAIRQAVARARLTGDTATLDDLPPALLADTAFLNRLQADVNGWIKEVQTVTKLSRDVASGTASQEINFWLSMDKALEAAASQLAADEVQLALAVLKNAKRFHATMSFFSDTGLKEAQDVVHKYNQLMKDFPLNELLSAADLDKVKDSLHLIFGHINKKLKVSPYPLRRTLPLVEAISRDFNDQLLKILSSHKIMFMDYATFERLMEGVNDVFAVWDENVKEFINVAREVMRKRAEKFIPIKLTPAHTKLQERVAYLAAFRRTHEQLRVMTEPARGLRNLGSERVMDLDLEKEVRLAYEYVKDVEVLDVSTSGTAIWVTAETAYNERVGRVENQIISRLRDRLGSAKNAHEMFRVFSKFNSLFVRPKIRGAIQGYQSQLIDSVKEDIKKLQVKFTSAYRDSQAYHMAQLRDIPPVAGAIIWARQIERQLDSDMRRVENVLGKGWELYAEGERLEAESASFRRKLNTFAIYDAWVQDTTRRESALSGRLLDIVRQRNAPAAAAGQVALELAVNFDTQAITLFKEVRNLLWLGFAVPHAIINFAKETKRVYPFAVGLMESVRTYNQMSSLIAGNPGISLLVAELRADAEELIVRGLGLRWESIPFYASQKGSEPSDDSSLGFFREFNALASNLQDKLTALLETWQSVDRAEQDLVLCPYEQRSIRKNLDIIQGIIDRLDLEGYTNLTVWVDALEGRISGILANRLSAELSRWCISFQQAGDPSSARRNVDQDETGKWPLTATVHEIRIRNQVLYVEPPLEHTKAAWSRSLEQVIAVVCDQLRLNSKRYEISVQAQDIEGDRLTYGGLLWASGGDLLREPLDLITSKTEEIRRYVEQWLRFQALWDLDSTVLYQTLGDSLDKWAQLMIEIRQSRSTFDTIENRKDFGVCVIDYGNVQSKVNTRYDTWQRDVLNKYGQRLGYSMRDVYGVMAQSRTDLEQQTLDGSSTAQAVRFITFVQSLKHQMLSWSSQLDTFMQGQSILERQRFAFPTDWLHADQLQGEWQATQDIMRRRDATMREQLEPMRMKVIAEEKMVNGRMEQLQADWEAEKPIRGGIRAETAQNTLAAFNVRLQNLQQEHAQIMHAKEALDLGTKKDDRLDPIAEELRDLKGVWTALSGLLGQVDQLRETLWSTIQPRKVRAHLDGLLTSAKEMPSRMRQYAAFEHVQGRIRDLLKCAPLVADLKSDALRERHWRQIFQKLRVDRKLKLSSITLGDVYDLDLKRNEVMLRDSITQAQGEMALEEFLRQVKEVWTSYSLELINYQNKCRLIRGWDELFGKCSEHLNSLSSMKSSPYYRVFEQDAIAWEDKLNRVHVLFDVWIDVQRQWVYLEGIFSGNADIKHLLPVESGRFGIINADFLAAMKKVSKSNLVLDVIALPAIQKNLERLLESLAKIQKALGEYLERERASFPRFYFIGDEDLLEIIGNGKDAHRVLIHLKKMFAGISSAVIDEDGTVISGMVSAEGEIVNFVKPIILASYPRVNDWLKQLEAAMRLALAFGLHSAVSQLVAVYERQEPKTQYMEWISRTPGQLCLVASQVVWTRLVEAALSFDTARLQQEELRTELLLSLLAEAVVGPMSSLDRRKSEQLVTELVHQRDVIRSLCRNEVSESSAFPWQYHMRYYLADELDNAVESLTVRIADASFAYGFEYLGLHDRLIQTPLTDNCFLTMTQALSKHLGGSPFGPAGTGKTESVKALGAQLGRFVLVFCCDETFDFQAMGRIFVGLCQVGAWGCFDEFNRLEERMLSAVSQQIQNIQEGLLTSASNAATEIDLVGRRLQLHPRTGIFITMNPGYAGRSNLPDNLKKLFRSMSMTRPDNQVIAQVMLFSHGFQTAEAISRKVVPFFKLCSEHLSKQPHYDFGLRALKGVLVTAGNLKREQHLGAIHTDVELASLEQALTLRSIEETVTPKLIGEDVALIQSLLQDVFPGITAQSADLAALRNALLAVCRSDHLATDEPWLRKVIQLYQVQQMSHGLVMVGAAATGKTKAWQTLQRAMEKVDGVEGVSYVIDPKALSKEALYGVLDHTTREWTDGLFTHILRKIVDNVRGESAKRHWIVFDGDVDPEWVENMNSLLDDNKLLTLPNGERLALPSNVRIMFEVEHLRFATLATVSRCGMIWFGSDSVSPSMAIQRYIANLRASRLDVDEEDGATRYHAESEALTAGPEQVTMAGIMERLLAPAGLFYETLDVAAMTSHIMEFSASRCLATFFSLSNKTVRNAQAYNTRHPDFPLTSEQTEQYLQRSFLLNMVWAMAGDSSNASRSELCSYVATHAGVELPSSMDSHASLIDYHVELPSAAWVSWQSIVPHIEIDTHEVTSSTVVIPTLDTVRHESVIYSWLSERKPVLLCGPPGSGKTMTLFNALRKMPDVDVADLNFSSATTPDLIMRVFEQHCEYRKTSTGTVLSPVNPGRWLVVFCDEINLPALDKYGTQRVISFMRQIIETGGFWRTADLSRIQLERIQFVGACNPPTDPGRIPLSQRFLRHAPVVMVDYPGSPSLMQIYSTYNRALLKLIPSLRGYVDALTGAMVDFYVATASRFKADDQAHYIYSPRELTRWSGGVYASLLPLERLDVEGLVRIWAHEGLRLFHDRLVHPEEREWTQREIDVTAARHFPHIDVSEALQRPILFSNWTTKDYVPIERNVLRDYTKARLRVFQEEELDVELVLFDDVLEHVLRIDRVFRRIQGHLLIIGVSGSGKTTLSRFVAWMNGLSVYQIKVSNRYTAEDFDEDLRNVLRRSGCKGEKICFIMDESNILDSGFLERMNTLLANAEVPGLFEGDDLTALMTACREGSQRSGLMLDSNEELYRWFTQQVAKNLHVVFTMNPPTKGGFDGRAATSPALFNRCVIDWFGDWSELALHQVGQDLSSSLDLDQPSYRAPSTVEEYCAAMQLPATHRSAAVQTMVAIHQAARRLSRVFTKRIGGGNFATPRHFLSFMHQLRRILTIKKDALEEEQRHLNVGLDKLRVTVEQVEQLRVGLAAKESLLQQKDEQANAKLRQMVDDQQAAETKRSASIQMQDALTKQNRLIAERRSEVMEELADAEPAVQEAAAAVGNIKKQHLSEVRSMSNPPESVKLAMESACSVLGHQIDSWKTVQSLIRREDFISSIQNFKTDRMSPAVRERMQRDYIGQPGFTYEAVNRASKACGPLVQWVIAQVRFSSILDKIGPLRREVAALEAEAEATNAQAVQAQATVVQLEASINSYKQEYATLISETQAIKTEMEQVQAKVDRSMTLVTSLASEQERWESGNVTFDQEMSTLVGDVLLSSAYLAYAGYFDQEHRSLLWKDWYSHLAAAGIAVKDNLSLKDYLSTVDEQSQWQADALPNDTLCMENAIMLSSFDRFPLLIDPSGQAIDYVKNSYKTQRLVVTSFSDVAFLKNLEGALRFGSPILIMDAENIDPIINPILNRETHKTGGRVLVRLGQQEIDLSPSFNLLLACRDSTAVFAPDVCSRVTFVNFTMTRASLQSQCLDQVLAAERPDTEIKRKDLMKLQGAYRVRLRQLERGLLQTLSESSGNILDDDSVIHTLELLKAEASDISHKVAEAETTTEEIAIVAEQYRPLSLASSAIYFMLEQLAELNHFYQFSLRYFLDIFGAVLHNNQHLAGVQAQGSRLEILHRDLYATTMQRTSYALLHEDQPALVLGLVRIKLAVQGASEALNDLDEILDLGSSSTHHETVQELKSYLPLVAVERLASLRHISGFAAIVSHVQADPQSWIHCLQSDCPETCVPCSGRDTSGPSLFTRVSLLAYCLRPDRLPQVVEELAVRIFGNHTAPAASYDLKNIVDNETDALVPIALASVAGFDASYKVEALIHAKGVKCTSVAMGSQEGFGLADQAIATAARTGSWVLLKNTHLAPKWLAQLEKRLQSIKAQPSFRIFITMDAVQAVPASVLRRSRVLMNEPSPGVRANIMDTLSALSSERLSKGPAEKSRVYLTLAWLHAVIQERLRFSPLGWSKGYEFNDADLMAALDTIDVWLNLAARGRANVSPSSIPWPALRAILKIAIYGGRIDSDFDQRVLETFVDTLFTEKMFDTGFELVAGNAAAAMPEGTSVIEYRAWASTLPEREPAAWLGLPESGERALSLTQGRRLASKLNLMRQVGQPDQGISLDEDELPQVVQGKNAEAQCSVWQTMLRGHEFATVSGNLQDVLGRLSQREAQTARKLRDQVLADLDLLMAVCKGSSPPTNASRALMAAVAQGTIPSAWLAYPIREHMTLSQWIADLHLRLDQVARLQGAGTGSEAGQAAGVNLGLLFHPESYITATQQAAAQRLGCSLEELSMVFGPAVQAKPMAFLLEGLLIEGAMLTDGALRLNDGEGTDAGLCQISWQKQRPQATAGAGTAADAKVLLLPVYLNGDRSQVLMTVDVRVAGAAKAEFIKRACCFKASA